LAGNLPPTYWTNGQTEDNQGECMTNPFNRGTAASGRARDASERPGSFKPGHAKVGGRKKGTPNALSVDYKKRLWRPPTSSAATAWALVALSAISSGCS
jgi:hypothetical protein